MKGFVKEKIVLELYGFMMFFGVVLLPLIFLISWPLNKWCDIQRKKMVNRVFSLVDQKERMYLLNIIFKLTPNEEELKALEADADFAPHVAVHRSNQYIIC